MNRVFVSIFLFSCLLTACGDGGGNDGGGTAADAGTGTMQDAAAIDGAVTAPSCKRGIA